MFNAFNTAFRPDAVIVETEAVPPKLPLADRALGELFNQFGGRSFNRGIYRVIAPRSSVHWNGLITSIFPSFSNRITCFAIDWLGRIFAIDEARLQAGRPSVVMFEPGTGEVLEIPCNIETFHESELIEYREEALAESFYQQWLKCGGAAPTLAQCVGYRKLLFLGGEDTVDNLEVSDLDVYWTIAAQLIQKIQKLPLGMSIGRITIG